MIGKLLTKSRNKKPETNHTPLNRRRRVSLKADPLSQSHKSLHTEGTLPGNKEQGTKNQQQKTKDKKQEMNSYFELTKSFHNLLENSLPMKALLLLVLGVISFIHQGDAQSLSPSVISSSGAFFQNSNAMLSSTIGEMTMVETFSAGGSILTQGFQQPFDFPVGIPQHSANHSLEIFPNPSLGDITVFLPDLTGDEIAVQVFDAIGKLVFRKVFHMNSPANRIHLSLNNLIDGMYVFEIKTKTDHYFRKVNIIR